MKVRELLRMSSTEIRAHKTRSALTALSLAIGIGAILFTFAEVSWMRRRLRNALELAGPGRLELSKKRQYVSRGLSPGLTSDDATAIRRNWPELYMVYPMARRWSARMTFRNFSSKDVLIQAVTPEWRRRDWVYRLRGRFIDDADMRNAARVCVVLQPGGWVHKPFWARYFPEQDVERELKHRDLLGERVQLEDHLFTVVGILQEPPRDRDPRWFRNWYSSSGGTLIVPITAYQRYLVPSYQEGALTQVDEIQTETGNAETASLYKRRIDGLLETLHRGEKDYDIQDYRERVQGAMRNIQESAAAILVIGIVAILAGGIGIMNVTLATIFSRIREIGIRRALGATRGEVVGQFVAEAMLLGLLGGAAGLPLGFAAAKYLAPDPDRIVLPGPLHMAAALLIAIGTGFLFSLYPAWQASKFDPIEALRYE